MPKNLRIGPPKDIKFFILFWDLKCFSAKKTFQIFFIKANSFPENSVTRFTFANRKFWKTKKSTFNRAEALENLHGGSVDKKLSWIEQKNFFFWSQSVFYLTIFILHAFVSLQQTFFRKPNISPKFVFLGQLFIEKLENC